MNLEDKQNDYSNLTIEEKLELILRKLGAIDKKLDVLENIDKENDLNTISEVSIYLNVSKATIYTMIKDNRLKENIHYKKLNKQRYAFKFIYQAIRDFKISYANSLEYAS